MTTPPLPKGLTPATLRKRLVAMGKNSTNATIAKQLKVSPQYLCDIQQGRRAPGPKVLRALGLREVITYEWIRHE